MRQAALLIFTLFFTLLATLTSAAMVSSKKCVIWGCICRSDHKSLAVRMLLSEERVKLKEADEVASERAVRFQVRTADERLRGQR